MRRFQHSPSCPLTPILPDDLHLLLIDREIDMRHTRSGHYNLFYLSVWTTKEKNELYLPDSSQTVEMVEGNMGYYWCVQTCHSSELIFSSLFHSLVLPTHYHSPQILAQIVAPPPLCSSHVVDCDRP